MACLVDGSGKCGRARHSFSGESGGRNAIFPSGRGGVAATFGERLVRRGFVDRLLGGDHLARYLWQDLQAEDWKVDFVGTHRDGANCEAGQLYDRDHDGYAGITAQTFLAQMDTVSPAMDPDTLLLTIGGNDIETTPDVGVIMERIRGIVEKARRKNPRLFIHLGMYGYVDVEISDATLDTFAERLQALAASLHASNSPVAFVDHRIGWVKATDLDTDLFHPSPAGMKKIAANWLRSIRLHHY